MQKGCDRVASERGMASWTWLVVLAIVLFGAVAVLKLLPRNQVPEPSPVVVARGKIQPGPAAPREETAETPQETGTEHAAPVPEKNHDTPPQAVTGEAGQVSDPGGADGSMGTSLNPSDEGAAPPVEPAADDKPMHASTPAVPPEDVSAAHTQVEAEQVETTAPASKTVQPASNETASNVLENESFSGQPADSAEDEAAGGNETAETLDAPDAAQDGGHAEPDAGQPSLFAVQVGAFRNKQFAQDMTSRLEADGYPAFIFEVMTGNQHPLYLVRFGRYPSRDEAVRSAVAFKKKEKMPVLVVAAESAE